MIAIIPAKGTSERLPGKNMIDLGGKPLIQWTIEAALESLIFKRVVVSSEDDEILRFSRDLGCTIYKRPEALADSTTRVIDVVKDVLANFPVMSFAVLTPTSPFRDAVMIREAKKEFRFCDCLMSVTDYEYPPDWALYANRVTGLVPYNPEGYKTKRQQLLPSYKHDGSIIMAKTEAFKDKSDWVNMEVIPYYIPRHDAVDIDEPIDLEWARFLLERKNDS